MADDRLISYQLHIALKHSQKIGIGRLGEFLFPAGAYIYTGSARRNLLARVRRHLSSQNISSQDAMLQSKPAQKKLRWHIDYFLEVARVTAVELYAEPECVCHQQVKGEILVPGFGASDCRAQCGSHLKYLGNG